MEFISDVNRDYEFDTECGAIQGLRNASGILVPGSGSRVPRAIFIGMFPSAIEAKSRRPMSGRIGNKLEECLNEAGMLRSDIFITYLIKYSMPSVRFPAEPTPEEIAESLPFMRREIAILRRGEGRTIVAMGLPVLRTLFPDSVSANFKRVSGEWTIFLIDDPREVLAGNDKRKQSGLQRALNEIGRHVNSLVE